MGNHNEINMYMIKIVKLNLDHVEKYCKTQDLLQ
jgi:hypothetical protein